MKEEELKCLCKIIKDFCKDKGYSVDNIDIDVGVSYYHALGDSIPLGITHEYTFKINVSDL